LKGQCFRDSSDIIKNVIEEPKRLSQNGLQDLHSCWQKIIVALEDLSEGNVAYMIVLLSISWK
jgi:hypothetical protein